MSIMIDLKKYPQPALEDLVKFANENGGVKLTDGGNVVAAITISGLQNQKKRYKRRAGSAAGLITVPEDFKAPMEEFKDYM